MAKTHKTAKALATEVHFHDKDGKPLGKHMPAKQSFKDQCDINNIVQKAQVTGVLSHVSNYAEQYGDFADFDYETALNQVKEAESMFYDLPSEVRQNEFKGNVQSFLTFVSTNTPEQIKEKLPMLAAPGRQFPDVVGGRQATEASPSEPSPEPAPTPALEPAAPAAGDPAP